MPYKTRMTAFTCGRTAAFLVAAAALAMPGAAQAYVGPGAGLTAIGSVLALIAALALAVVGFVWYPLKRLMKRKPAGETPRVDATGDGK